MREIALTIKPTMSCNMKCQHCFNGDSLNHSDIISVERVMLLLQKASDEYESIKITFHGGEPTLAGIEFYNKIFEFEHELNAKTGTVFRNFFTTNGLLLDESFIKLLISNDTLINVSYDGPFNYILRQNSEKVLNNIELIQSMNGKIRCYCTISKDSCMHLSEIYDWFNERKLDFKTLPVEKVGYAKSNDSIIMSPDDLVENLINLYRRWIHDKNFNIRYYTFEEFANLRRNMQFKSYWFNRKIALNPDGNIYPFGRPNDIKFCLGTPESIEIIEDCFKSESYLRLRDILENMCKCKCGTCESLGVCNGVAICMTYMYEDDEEIIDYSCKQANKIFQGILSVNDEIIRDFEAGKIESYSDFIRMRFDGNIKAGESIEQTI